jgi:glycosyltransferase involved in cell wall biosynthesis
MRIGIDCTVMGRPLTGFESYVSCLTSALTQLESDAEFVLFVPRPLPPDLASLRGRFTIVTSPLGSEVLTNQVWLAATVRVHRIDLMHYPAFPPLLPPAKFVMTVHDAVPWKFGETMPAKTRVYFQSTLGLWTRKSRLIITPSESSKTEIADRFGLAGDSVRVIAHGVRNSLRPRSPTESAVLPDRLRIDPGYALFVGTVEPRKNLPLIIQAIAKLRAGGTPCRLVVAGRLAWGRMEVESILEKEQVKDVVFLLGHVSDEELASLYRNALCLVRPSLHEGFGYTIIEAMALGCPVIASDIPPHVEVMGDSGIYVSPHDVEGVANALARLLRDPLLRATLAERAVKRSEEFTWKRSAERTLEAYRDAIGWQGSAYVLPH